MTKEDIDILVSGVGSFNLSSEKEFWTDDNIRLLIRYHSVLCRTQYMERKEFLKIKSLRLKFLLQSLYLHSEFWRCRFDELGVKTSRFSLVDFNHLPVMEGYEVKSIPTIHSRGHETIHDYSFGPDGSVLEVIQDRREVYLSYFGYLFRSFSTPEKTIQRMFDQGFFVGINIPNSKFLLSRNSSNINISTLRSTDAVIKDIVRSCKEKEFAILCSYISPLEEIVTYISQGGQKIPSLIGCMVSRDEIDFQKIQFIERKLKCPVRRFFLRRDIGIVAWECDIERGVYHVNEERIFLQVVDSVGEDLLSNQWGDVVVTVLDFSFSPFIRYKTGEVGRIIRGGCSCGRTLQKIELRPSREEKILKGRTLLIPFIQSCILTKDRASKLDRYSVQIDGDRVRIVLFPRRSFSEIDLLDMRLSLYEMFSMQDFNVDVVVGDN